VVTNIKVTTSNQQW